MEVGRPTRRKHRAVRVCVLALFVPFVVGGCAPEKKQLSDDPGRLSQRIDQEIQRFQDQKSFPGLSVAVMRGTEVVFAKGYGMADVERHVPVTPRTMFPIGSIEKQFAAAAVMRLVEQGRIRLEDPITRYLPRLDTGRQVVTIADMLNQVSGLQELSTLEAGRATAPAPHSPEESWGPVPDRAVGEGFDSGNIALFQGQPLYFRPRERFSYSNSNYDLLCYVIAALTHDTYYAAIRDVAKSAGLETFHPEWTPRPPGDDPDVAHGYRAGGEGFEEVWESNLGSAWTTAVGLARWGQALDAGRVVSRESYARMTSPARLNDGRIWPYGFGLDLLTFEGAPKIMHTGVVLGFNAVLARYPKQDITIAIMTNLGRAGFIAYELEPDIWRLLEGIAPPKLLDLPLDAEERARIVGTYDGGAYWFDVVPNGERIELIMRDPGYVQDGEVYYHGRLRFQGNGRFVAKDAPVWSDVSFRPDRGQAVEVDVGSFAQAFRRPIE